MRHKKWLIKSAQWLGIYERSDKKTITISVGNSSTISYKDYEKWLESKVACIMIADRFATLPYGYYPLHNNTEKTWSIRAFTPEKIIPMSTEKTLNKAWMSAMFYEIYLNQCTVLRDL